MRNSLPYQLTAADEAKIYSQHGEDGILAKIESLLGDQLPRTFVELGASPSECNTLALRVRGWDGIMIDEQGGEGIIPARITRENIDDLIEEHFNWPRCGVLSVDLDGNDFWIVDALKRLRPIVIVVEYNAHFDSKVKLATPYREPRKWSGGCDYSASLSAWDSMLRQRWDTVLCYVESSASNAFFVSIRESNNQIDFSRPLSVQMPTPTYCYGDVSENEWIETT